MTVKEFALAAFEPKELELCVLVVMALASVAVAAFSAL